MPKLWAISPQLSHEDVFVQRYERLLSQALHITEHSRSKAEDLVHDAFIQFTLSQPDLTAINDLDSYLFIVLRNMHLSQVRRASQVRFTPFSIIEYDSAAIGLRAADAQTHMQVAEELRRICNYACIRKETSKAASVLILRFFHGYYTTEIAQVMCAQRGAVDQWLRLARREVKAYLDDPHSLKFMTEVVEDPTAHSIATTTSDLLSDLRELIFRSRRGVCLPAKRLAKLYRESESVSIKSELLAHLVSCPSCLEEVNKLRGLPPSSDRYPADTLGPDRRSRGGGERMNMRIQGGDPNNQFMKVSRRRLGEVIDHRPQALSFSVNGFILGSQKVRSDLTEQILSINIDEEISFVEVFSEQGMRLMFMGVASPATAGVEQKARLNLGEGREVRCALSFSSPWPTLHVSYHDPAFGAQVAELETTQNQEPRTSSPETPDVSNEAHKSSKAEIRSGLSKLRRSLTDWSFWLRPGMVTAIVALLLVATMLSLYLRVRPPAVMASDLLQRSAQAEYAIAARPDTVLHRTLQLEERRVAETSVCDVCSGELIAKRRIEIWQSASNGISARRLFDEKGSLIAGDWRRSDGVQTLYHHGARPQLQIRNPQSAIRNFDSVWQLEPSAKEFSELIKGTQNAHVEERGSVYIISKFAESVDNSASASASSAVNYVVRATLTLSRADLHPIEQTLVIQQGSETREYHFVEVSLERRSPGTVAPAVFEPDPELLSLAKSNNLSPTPNTLAPVPGAEPPTPVSAATAAMEVEVLSLLGQISADMGQEVSVKREGDGALHVEAIVDSAKRKVEILSALAPVAHERAVKLRIETTAEAQARLQRERRRSGAASGSQEVSLEGVTTANAIPVDAEVRRYLRAKGIPENQLDNELSRLSNRMLNRSHQALLHAFAIKNLVQRFSEDDLRSLDPEARAKWRAMIATHAASLQRDLAAIRQELTPIFSAGAGSSGEAMEVADNAALFRAVVRLTELASFTNESIQSAFTISPVLRSVTIRTPQFWSSLGNAEQLAKRIQAADIRR